MSGGSLGTAQKRSASIVGMRACNSLGENNDGVGRGLPMNLSVGIGKWRARGLSGGMMGTSGGGGGENARGRALNTTSTTSRKCKSDAGARA